jgi:nucleotide-binding universal stress UspA family protein
MTRKILVATDGSEGSAGALRMARLLETREGAHVELLAVCPPVYLYPGGYVDATAPIPPELTLAATEPVRASAEALATRVGLATRQVIVESGSVAATIARVATQRKAELIMLGLAGGEGFGHWLARETLLRLSHLAHVPVLAVPATMSARPRDVVIGSDFSEFSFRAAHEAVRQVEVGARVHLIHVIREFTWTAGGPAMRDWATTYREGVQQRLRKLANDLARSGRVTVREHIRVGDPAEEILKLANEVRTDLIAVGSHGWGYFARMVLGSISAPLIHQARCAVLVSPPQTIPAELNLDLTDTELMEALGFAGEMASEAPVVSAR